jgi:iron complex transport system substrate-binding protein
MQHAPFAAQRAALRCLRLAFAGLFLPLLLCLPACQPDSSQQAARQTAADSVGADAPVPDSLSLQYAKGFRVEQAAGHTLLTLTQPFEDQSDTLRYWLLRRGTKRPARFPEADILRVPVREMVLLAPSHYAMAEALGALNRISGIAQPRYVNSDTIRRLHEAGQIEAVGPTDDFSAERVMALQPGLIMVGIVSASRFGKFEQLRQAGIPTLVNSEWRERHPLGRAEWIKLVGLLTGKLATARAYFRAVAQRYRTTRQKIERALATAADRPTLLRGLPYKDTWYVAGGASYAAQLMADAGGDYPWADRQQPGALSLDFESVYPVGLQADIWLQPGQVQSLSAIRQRDPRYADFRAFQAGRVYNNTRRLNGNGGNDYWEQGVIEPDVILKDLAKICHPTLMQDHAFQYYEKLD